jgi:hypothetical protein
LRLQNDSGNKSEAHESWDLLGHGILILTMRMHCWGHGQEESDDSLASERKSWFGGPQRQVSKDSAGLNRKRETAAAVRPAAVLRRIDSAWPAGKAAVQGMGII